MSDDDVERALRFRNYAEELRVIAASGATPETRKSLQHAAAEYDQMAASLEAIAKSKRAAGLVRGEGERGRQRRSRR